MISYHNFDAPRNLVFIVIKRFIELGFSSQDVYTTRTSDECSLDSIWIINLASIFHRFSITEATETLFLYRCLMNKYICGTVIGQDKTESFDKLNSCIEYCDLGEMVPVSAAEREQTACGLQGWKECKKIIYNGLYIYILFEKIGKHEWSSSS